MKQSIQDMTRKWLVACLGELSANNKVERNYRFLEESLELVQACGLTESEAHQLVRYVYERPTGELLQEIGGVLLTLASLCSAHGVDMDDAGNAELQRAWKKITQIRAKQAAKPKLTPTGATTVRDESNWMSDAAGRIFTYAIEWNEGRKVWRDEDIVNIIKHASSQTGIQSRQHTLPEVVTGGCICGHGFNDHEHPAKPWMAINSKMMDTELAACKLCDCDIWREPESLMDNDEEE